MHGARTRRDVRAWPSSLRDAGEELDLAVRDARHPVLLIQGPAVPVPGLCQWYVNRPAVLRLIVFIAFWNMVLKALSWRWTIFCPYYNFFSFLVWARLGALSRLMVSDRRGLINWGFSYFSISYSSFLQWPPYRPSHSHSHLYTQTFPYSCSSYADTMTI